MGLDNKTDRQLLEEIHITVLGQGGMLEREKVRDKTIDDLKKQVYKGIGIAIGFSFLPAVVMIVIALVKH